MRTTNHFEHSNGRVAASSPRPEPSRLCCLTVCAASPVSAVSPRGKVTAGGGQGASPRTPSPGLTGMMPSGKPPLVIFFEQTVVVNAA
jgi:hypothetical protein